MSKENAIKVLRELKTNEKAKEFLQGRERPKTKEDAIKAYNDIDMFPRTRRSVPEPDRTDGHELCDSNPVDSCHVETVCLLTHKG